MNIKLAAISIMFLIFSGCALTPQNKTYEKPKITAIFNEHELEKYNKQGNSSIKGQAFTKVDGGEVRFAAGDEVFLLPITEYTQKIIPFFQGEQNGARIAFDGYIKPLEQSVDGVDSRWRKYLKKTVADGNGNFEFENLPEGDYYIQSSIFWKESIIGRSIYGDGFRVDGKVVTKKITLHKDEHLKAIVNEDATYR